MLQLVDQHTVTQVFCCVCQPVPWQIQSVCQSAHGHVWVMGHAVAYLSQNGCSKLALVQQLCWRWKLGVNGCSFGVLLRQDVDWHCCIWLCWSACLTDLMHASANPLDWG